MRGTARPRRSAAVASSGAAARQVEGNSPTAAPPPFVARLVPLPPGLYAVELAGDVGRREPPPDLLVSAMPLPSIHVVSPPGAGAAIEITDRRGGAGAWLGGRNTALFAKSPGLGGTLLVTGFLPRDPKAPPLGLTIRRLDGPVSDAPAETTIALGGPAAPSAPPWRSLELLAHIRGRGDVRFVDPAWAGRLGRGQWIETFAILPLDQGTAAAIEYKGLAADGTETAWLGAGARCGTQGRALPLVGFAVRAKAIPDGSRLDCEYSGYFSSGAIAGPVRNGAPCLSARDNDPLEGIQLRIAERAASQPVAGR